MKKQHKPKVVMNGGITSDLVRIVNSGDELDGIYSRHVAISLANQEEKDLIEMSVTGDTSICRVIEYSKYVYQLRQKEKELRKNSSHHELHEVRLSLDISDNDIAYRVKQAIEWLKKGDKVKCEIRVFGRRLYLPDSWEKAQLVLLKFAEAVVEYGKPESLPNREGKRMSFIIKPSK
jgi:translation initiation factor IF-3